MQDSAYQKAVYAFVKGETEFNGVDFKGKKNLIVEAVAGSGKTTTIVKALQFMGGRKPLTAADLANAKGNFESLFGGPKNPRVLFVAFNKHIAEELQKGVPSYVTASTLNSVGWGICRTSTKCELDKYKD